MTIVFTGHLVLDAINSRYNKSEHKVEQLDFIYLQCVLNAVGEVLESTQRDSIART